KEWGLEWAKLVASYFDFEASKGYEEGGLMGTTSRPTAVGAWLGRGRKWNTPMGLGTLGDEKDEKGFAATWWRWWHKALYSEGGNEPDWDGMCLLYGRNGVLHVMATLLWWGDAVADGDDEDAVGSWKLALDEVQWALRQML
ncbi:hypothetical protein DFH07DRAFT_702871, partial [Mycena maculata]